MFKKKNLIYIILFFIILLLIVIGIEYFKEPVEVKTLPENLIEIEIDEIDEFWIMHEFDEKQKVRIFKTEDSDWVLDAGDGRPLDIRQDVLNSSLDHLRRLRPDALAGSDKDSWQEFKVDSNGTLLRVFSKSQLMASLVLGKMDFKDQAVAITYVRPEQSEETYVVDLYLESSLKAQDDHWRSTRLIESSSDQWQQIYIDYGNEGGYTLYNVEGKWLLGEMEIEDTLINTFLEGFVNLHYNEFVPELYSDDLFRPVLRADFISHQGTTTSLNVFNSDHGRVITSTANRGNVMKAPDEIVEGIYFPRNYFLK